MSRPSLIDAHVHFDDPRLDADRDAAWQRAQAAGVVAMVVPGVTAATFERTRAVCAANPALHACYGLHPYFLDQHDDESDLQTLDEWLARERPVALGECGLDFFRDDLDRDRQFALFEAQISLAKAHDLPLVIHARKSLDEVYACLRRAGHHRGQLHSFGGSEQQMQRFVDLGYHISFCAAITHPGARKLRRVAAAVPADALLIETDAPDQPGAAHRGERNEPAWLPEVLAALAAARGEPVEQLAEVTRANTESLFCFAS
jgi:TatD DNase family protein